MRSGHSTLVLLLVLFSTAALAQNPNSSLPRWTVLVDPVCPVSTLYARPFPNATKQMRVLYFPAAKEAKLKNPESLTLNVGFNMPSSAGRPIVPDTSKIPFTHNGDGWEAIVPLEKQHTAYAIFAVQDDKSNVDDNNGQLWDVVFCDPVGKKDTNGVLHEAQSYTDASWSPTLHRIKDYNKAISILENYLAQDSNVNSSFFLLPNLWEYKAERDGGNAQAYAKLSKELDQYLTEHRDDKRAAGTVGNFVVRHQDQLPAEFVERIISTLDAKRNDPKHSLRADVTYTRAVKETDLRKRLAALDAFVANYPQALQVQFAQQSRFYTFVELKDVHGAEAALTSYRLARARDRDVIHDPNGANVYLAMAQLYVDNHEKLDTALKLADEAQETVNADLPHGMTIPPEFKQNVEARCAEMRARAYIALKQSSQAIAEAGKALLALKESAEAHFVTAQAYAIGGEKQKALDEYFEAALMPSNDDLKYRAELERFYRKNFGNAKKYQAALNKRIADRFQAANYVPKLLDQPAPVLEFTTNKGEKFDAKELSGKTVVLNFWSPG